MGRGRGRPRNVPDLDALATLVEQVTLDKDNVPTLHKLTPTATRGGMYRRNDQDVPTECDNPSRMAKAIKLVERIRLHGGDYQVHHNCVTVTLGKYAECMNISSHDIELERLVNRVINAGVQ